MSTYISHSSVQYAEKRVRTLRARIEMLEHTDASATVPERGTTAAHQLKLDRKMLATWERRLAEYRVRETGA